MWPERKQSGVDNIVTIRVIGAELASHIAMQWQYVLDCVRITHLNLLRNSREQVVPAIQRPFQSN